MNLQKQAKTIKRKIDSETHWRLKLYNSPKGSASVMIFQNRSVVVQKSQFCTHIDMEIVRSSSVLKIMDECRKYNSKYLQIGENILEKNTNSCKKERMII